MVEVDNFLHILYNFIFDIIYLILRKGFRGLEILLYYLKRSQSCLFDKKRPLNICIKILKRNITKIHYLKKSHLFFE